MEFRQTKWHDDSIIDNRLNLSDIDDSIYILEIEFSIRYADITETFVVPVDRYLNTQIAQQPGSDIFSCSLDNVEFRFTELSKCLDGSESVILKKFSDNSYIQAIVNLRISVNRKTSTVSYPELSISTDIKSLSNFNVNPLDKKIFDEVAIDIIGYSFGYPVVKN